MKVDDLDIPDRAKDIIKEEGIQELYPPQEEGVEDVLASKNCVFAFPTASGKSLLAYLSIIKKVVEEGGKALYIVPLRALASEKVEDLKRFEELGLKVGISMGDYDDPDPSLKDNDVIIATSEKADSLLRHNLDWVHRLNAVIADEVHLVNDRERGATLEITLSKLKQANPDAQIVALSATIQNSWSIAEWLDAEHHKSDWRPVELKEGVYYNGSIRYVDGDEETIEDGEPIPSLCLPTIEEGDQCLVFVKSRRSSQAVSQRMSSKVKKYLSEEEREELESISEDLLERSQTSIGERLAESVKKGTAFHNAGLSNHQRKVIESAFKKRLIKLISATPTLAAGINMPARKVVVRDTRRYDGLLGYNAPIPVMEIKQMCGRAGRPGYDDLGEAILVAKKKRDSERLFEEYLLGQSEAIVSRMASEPALRAHLLALIATTHCESEEEIYEFMNQTFFVQHSEIWSIKDRVRKTLDLLEKEELVEREDDILTATRFGKRVSNLYIDPLSAINIRDAVQSGKMGINLSYLHTICQTPDMYTLFIKKEELSKYERRLDSVRADLFESVPHDRGEKEAFLAAFKTALMLQDWINEVSEKELNEKYGVGPGDIYNKVETSEWLLHSAAEIAEMFDVRKEEKLRKLTARVKHGIKEELMPLMEMEQIGRVRARTLFNAGYKTTDDVRAAAEKEIEDLSGLGRKLAKKITEEGEKRDKKVDKERNEREESSTQVSLSDF